MRKVLTAAVALVAAVSLSACNGGSKQAAPAAPDQTAAAARPPLKVPASFKDDQEKLAFAAKAVDDKYYQEAVPLLEQIMTSNPSAEASKRLGTARYNLNDYTGAIAAWTEAGELAPPLKGEMLNNIGNALRDEKKFAAAEASYRKALEMEPTRWTAAINLAQMLDEQGHVDAAIKVLEDAMPANPHIGDLTSQLASYQQALSASNTAKS